LAAANPADGAAVGSHPFHAVDPALHSAIPLTVFRHLSDSRHPSRFPEPRGSRAQLTRCQGLARYVPDSRSVGTRREETKATNDAAALAGTAKAFRGRYSGSSWAKKASIWG